MLRHPCILGGPQRQARGAKSEMAASPLPCPEAQKRADMLWHTSMLGGPQRQARGAKAEVAISPLPSRGAKGGQKCFATPAFSGVPHAKRGEQNQKCLPHPFLNGRPKRGRKCYVTPFFLGGKPTASAGSKIRNGCLTIDFLAAQKRAKMLRHRCVLGGPQRQARGAKSEVAISPPPSRGAKRGRKCYVCCAFSEVPNAKRGEQN